MIEATYPTVMTYTTIPRGRRKEGSTVYKMLVATNGAKKSYMCSLWVFSVAASPTLSKGNKKRMAGVAMSHMYSAQERNKRWSLPKAWRLERSRSKLHRDDLRPRIKKQVSEVSKYSQSKT